MVQYPRKATDETVMLNVPDGDSKYLEAEGGEGEGPRRTKAKISSGKSWSRVRAEMCKNNLAIGQCMLLLVSTVALVNGRGHWARRGNMARSGAAETCAALPPELLCATPVESDAGCIIQWITGAGRTNWFLLATSTRSGVVSEALDRCRTRFNSWLLSEGHGLLSRRGTTAGRCVFL